MTTSNVPVTPGSGDNIATYSFTEDAVTKQLQRVALGDSTGADLGGSKTDAAATNTDTTAISWTAILKQVSKSVQAIATFVKVSDGTNTAAVKPASTAALATDPALVVTLSPNGVNANGQTTMSASAPVAIASDQSTLAIATDTSALMNGRSGVTLTPATAKVNISTASTTTVVSAVTSKKIRILAMYLVNGTSSNNINWQSHTTTSNGDSVLSLTANSGIVLNFNPVGWFDTTAGEGLDIVTSAATQLSGRIVYVAV